MSAKKSASARKAAPAEGKARGRKRVDENETREQKFVRLAQYRMSKTLNDLRNVKNLARYPHTPEQGQKIVDALQAAVDSIGLSFSESPKAEKPTFEF